MSISPSVLSQTTLPEVLSQIQEIAIAHSPDLLTAKAIADQKHAGHTTAVTHLIPHLDLQLSQSRSIDYSILTSGALGNTNALSALNFTPQAQTLSRWALNLDLPIYRRAVHMAVQQATAESLLADHELTSTKAEVSWKTRSLLGNYLYQVYRDMTLSTSKEIARSNLREASLRFRLGHRTRVDVLRAESNLVSLESQELTYHQERETKMNLLLEYLGVTKQDFEKTGLNRFLFSRKTTEESIELFSNTDQGLTRLAPYLEKPIDEQEEIFARSPGYKTTLYQEEVTNQEAQTLMAQEWPEFSIQGSLNKQAPAWGDAFAGSNISKSIGVVLTVHLFSGGSLFSTAREKRARQDQATILEKRDWIRLRDEIETDRLQIQALKKSADSLKLNVAQNHELVRLSVLSYQLGKGTLVELLDSQRGLQDSELALMKTKIDLATSLRKFAWNMDVIL